MGKFARMLDKQVVSSVHAAVEKLNKSELQCPEDFCVAFSASSNGYYLLHRRGCRDKALTKLMEHYRELTSAKAKMQSEILALKAQKLQVADPDPSSSTALEQKLKESQQNCMQAETALARERETSDQLRRACDAVEIKLASVLASESEMKELMFKAEAELKVKDDLQ